MAIRFDASADRLLRTSDLLDYNAAYTWMAWARIATDTNAYVAILTLNRGDDTAYETVGLNSDGTTLALQWYDGTNWGEPGGTNLTAGTWYHIAIVRTTTSQAYIYLNGVQDISFSTSIASRAAANRMEIGAKYTGNYDPLNGNIFAVKAWSAGLTIDEVNLERLAIRPIRTNNLYGFWPCLPGATERDNDYSGNGRDWTQGGTLTDEDPPPVSWGGQIWALPFVAAAGGDPEGSLIGGKLIRGGLLVGGVLVR